LYDADGAAGYEWEYDSGDCDEDVFECECVRDGGDDDGWGAE
jgi:hypothetical protein